MAAAAVAAVYYFAREALNSRTEALLAATLFACSPLFVLQSATYLPHVSSLRLLTLFAASMLRAVRNPGRVGYSPTAVLGPTGTPRPVALAAVDFGPDGPYLAGSHR